MKKLLLIHKDRNKLQKDGWRYGDWTQYVAFFEDKSAVCCRTSSLPSALGLAGFIGLTFPLMAIWLAFEGVEIIWPRVIGTAVIALMLLVPWTITWFTKWRLMVPVSGKLMPDENGSYWRDI